MANDNTTTEMVSGTLRGTHLRLTPLPLVNDDELGQTLDDIAGIDPHLEAILRSNPIQTKEEILREACRDLVESKFRYLTENYPFKPFFREEYASTTLYDGALQDLSKELKQTFKELRDNAEDEATKRIFDGYYRTAHLQLKNKTARAEYVEEQRLLNVLDANEFEREIIEDEKGKAEKAFCFNIFFSDRVNDIVKESKEAIASKADLEKRLYTLADAMKPAGIREGANSWYHERAGIVVETVGDELTKAQRQRTEAASIAVGRAYTSVPAFERKYAARKKQVEASEGDVYEVAPFYQKMQEIITESNGRKNAVKRKAYELLAEEYQAGTAPDVMNTYKAYARHAIDNASTIKASEYIVSSDSREEQRTAQILTKGPRRPVRLRQATSVEDYTTQEAEEDAEVVTYINGRPASHARRVVSTDVDYSGSSDLAYVRGIIAQVEAQGATARKAGYSSDNNLHQIQGMSAEIEAPAWLVRRQRKDASTLDDSFFGTHNPNTAQYAENPSILDDPVVEAPEVLERRVRRAGFLDRAVGAMQIGLLSAAAAAFVAGIGYFAKVSSEAYDAVYNSFAQKQEQVIEEAYKPAETIEQKVQPQKTRVGKQKVKTTTNTPAMGNYVPSEDAPMSLKPGSYSTEDITVELTQIKEDYTVTIPSVEIKITPQPVDDVYRVLGEARDQPRQTGDETTAPREDQREYKLKPQGATYSLGIEVPTFPEHKPLDLRVDTNARDAAIDYSRTLPERAAPDKVVLFRF